MIFSPEEHSGTAHSHTDDKAGTGSESDRSTQRTRYVTFVLEDLYQPHNAASVMRTCDNFGLQDLHVIAAENRFSFDPATSQGAEHRLSMTLYTNATHSPRPNLACMAALKGAGYRIVATTLQPGAIEIDELSLDHQVALCFGTEEKGLSPALHEAADDFVYIPMYGFTQSFNISVCAAICAARLTKRLRASSLPWPLDANTREPSQPCRTQGSSESNR